MAEKFLPFCGLGIDENIVLKAPTHEDEGIHEAFFVFFRQDVAKVETNLVELSLRSLLRVGILWYALEQEGQFGHHLLPEHLLSIAHPGPLVDLINNVLLNVTPWPLSLQVRGQTMLRLGGIRMAIRIYGKI